MATISLSQVIDRRPEIVFDFVAVNHLRNHPRWDPHMKLELLTDGETDVGTRFKRTHTRTGVPIEGEMEVVEFEPGRSMAMVIRDRTPSGILDVRSRMLVEPDGDGGTKLTIWVDIPAMHESMDQRMIEASLHNMKRLIESET